MIFVTGGTGLIGSHLLFELAKQGKRVRALKRSSSNVNLVRNLFSAYGDESGSDYQLIEWVDGDYEYKDED